MMKRNENTYSICKSLSEHCWSAVTLCQSRWEGGPQQKHFPQQNVDFCLESLEPVLKATSVAFDFNNLYLLLLSGESVGDFHS